MGQHVAGQKRQARASNSSSSSVQGYPPDLKAAPVCTACGQPVHGRFCASCGADQAPAPVGIPEARTIPCHRCKGSSAVLSKDGRSATCSNCGAKCLCLTCPRCKHSVNHWSRGRFANGVKCGQCKHSYRAKSDIRRAGFESDLPFLNKQSLGAVGGLILVVLGTIGWHFLTTEHENAAGTKSACETAAYADLVDMSDSTAYAGTATKDANGDWQVSGIIDAKKRLRGADREAFHLHRDVQR